MSFELKVAEPDDIDRLRQELCRRIGEASRWTAQDWREGDPKAIEDRRMVHCLWDQFTEEGHPHSTSAMAAMAQFADDVLSDVFEELQQARKALAKGGAR